MSQCDIDELCIGFREGGGRIVSLLPLFHAKSTDHFSPNATRSTCPVYHFGGNIQSASSSMSIPVEFAPLCDDAVLLELNISFAALSADERCRFWELHE